MCQLYMWPFLDRGSRKQVLSGLCLLSVKVEKADSTSLRAAKAKKASFNTKWKPLNSEGQFTYGPRLLMLNATSYPLIGHVLRPPDCARLKKADDVKVSKFWAGLINIFGLYGLDRKVFCLLTKLSAFFQPSTQYSLAVREKPYLPWIHTLYHGRPFSCTAWMKKVARFAHGYQPEKNSISFVMHDISFVETIFGDIMRQGCQDTRGKLGLIEWNHKNYTLRHS